MTTVGFSELRLRLDEYLASVEDDLLTATSDDVVAVSQAWFRRTVDSVRAALVLHDQDLGAVAAPLLRCAMEHAVGIAWLSMVGPQGVRTLSRARQKWASDVKKARAAANDKGEEREPGREGWPRELEEVIDRLLEIEVPPSPTDKDAHVLHRFATAGAEDLFVAWLNETGYSHASEASALAYVAVRDDRYLLLPRPRRQADTLEMRCALVVVNAARAMGKILAAPVWDANVSRLDDDLVAAYEAAKVAGTLDPRTEDHWLHRFDQHQPGL